MVSCMVSSLRHFISSSRAFSIASGMLIVNLAIGISLDFYRPLWKYSNMGNDKEVFRTPNVESMSQNDPTPCETAT